MSFNEYGPAPRVVEADAAILSNAYDDARRKAVVLAKSVHATLGDPIAVDEVNAADPYASRSGGDVALKGVSITRGVSVPAGGPEIVRVTFALSSRGRGPSSVTVYGLQGTSGAGDAAPPTHVSIEVRAAGVNALQTVGSWEALIRDAARKHGIRDGDIRVGNVNAQLVGRPR